MIEEPDRGYTEQDRVIYGEIYNMPIYMAQDGQDVTVKQVRGTDKIKKHLENLGFVSGVECFIVSHVNESVIIKIKGVSLAISHDLAKRILI